jgi:gamma-glutamylcyclotransferase (GGCT)/AIG2-like uncharacterized protein YtfP
MNDSQQSVFVYGTLKPGGHYWPRFCEGKVLPAIPAKIRGELYDLHVGYPGMFMRGEHWVQGVLLTFPSKADFDQLDVLEGFDPDRPEEENEYVRRLVICFDINGEPLRQVWAYEMTETTFSRCAGTRIEDGIWPIG